MHRALKGPNTDLPEFVLFSTARTSIYTEGQKQNSRIFLTDITSTHFQKPVIYLLKICCAPVLFSGKPEEFPRKPLGQELPVLLSPVQPTRGKPSSASGFPRADLSIHIISHQPDSISPDQSPSKDPRDLDAVDEEEAPLPSPDPVIIHSQAPLTPDGSPLTGPPPYQPPGNQAVVTTDHPSLPDQMQTQIADALSPASTDESSVATRSAVSTDQSVRKVPRTLSAPVAQVASSASGLAQSESLSAAERAEDSYLVQLLEQASALATNRNLNQDSRESEDTQAPDIS